MGNGGGQQVPTQPPPQQMPIKDDIRAKQEAAKAAAVDANSASRTADDLDGSEANREQAITRKTLGMTEKFAPQARPTGPADGKRVRGPRVTPGSTTGGTMSAVITG